MSAGFSVRDPIHGFIRADALEGELVSSRPVQRLRSIRQLGLAHLVFPGAEHSRFSHVLGVMHLAGRLYDALAQRHPDLLDADPRAPERRSVRAAALLHDIGHAPFSHTAEALFDEPIDHEEMTRRLIGLPELSGAIERHGLSVEGILDLLAGRGSGTSRVLCQMVSGELDVDKMDYLMRDSLFCGVEYGRFDLGRLLETVAPIRDPTTGDWGLGVTGGGVHALEALVLARYYMFTQVYFNVTVKVLELHLNQWLEESGVKWPVDPEAFLDTDDVTVLSQLRRSSSRHASALLQRDRYQLVAETREHLEADEKARFEARLQPVLERYGEQAMVSRSAKDPHRLRRSRVLVQWPDGRFEPMDEASHFIRHLTRIDQYRVYADPSVRAEMAAALADEPES